MSMKLLILTSALFIIMSSGLVAASTKPSEINKDSFMQLGQKCDSMIHLSKPVENAILQAGHSSRIVGIERARMAISTKCRSLLFVVVELIPKSKKSWEGILHLAFIVVEDDRKGLITVYDIDATIISPSVLFDNWISNSRYKLPVGHGLTKLLEVKTKKHAKKQRIK